MSRDIQYIGMDVHMEAILETKASSILQFIHGLRGELHVTWEEGTWAAWLYDLLQPQVHEILVCNPRRNALLKEGSKSDKVDARKLAELLRTGMLRPVYHGENGLRTLRELARSYQTISKDLTRVMNRLKALYRGWGIPCAGTQVYAPRYREEWLSKIPQTGVRRRAELLYQQLDGLQALRRNLRPNNDENEQARRTGFTRATERRNNDKKGNETMLYETCTLINLEGVEHDCNPSVAALRLYSHGRNDHSHRAGIDHPHRRNTQSNPRSTQSSPTTNFGD